MNVSVIGLIVVAAFFAISAPAETPAHSESKPRTLDELFAATCEHKIPQYTCEECRYELGLVKLDTSLIRKPDNPESLLTLETVAKHKAQMLLPLTGEVALNENALWRISPRVAGTVSRVNAVLGAQVRRGDVLFELESADLGLAIATYRKNKALSVLALKNCEREKALAKQRLSPEADAVEAQMKYDEYRVEQEAAKSVLAVMGLDAAAIEALASDTVGIRPGTLPVRSPQNGVVIGQRLTLGETLEAGKEVLTIADLSTVWVWMNVYESDLAKLTTEAQTRKPRVRLAFAAFPERRFAGEIDLISAVMDESTRTVRARAAIKNADAVLRPGMFCDARVVFDVNEDVIAVPLAAVMGDEGNRFVFRTVRDGFALRTDVETGRVFSDRIEIKRGLNPGDQIVTEGAFVLKSDVLRSKMGAGCAD